MKRVALMTGNPIMGPMVEVVVEVADGESVQVALDRKRKDDYNRSIDEYMRSAHDGDYMVGRSMI